MKLKTLSIMAAIIAPLVFILLGLAVHNMTAYCNQTHRNMTVAKKLTYQCFLVVTGIVALLFLIYPLALTHGALAHGAENPGDMNITDINYALDHTPEEAKFIPDDLAGQIVIYYRFDCPTCLDIHDELMQAIGDRPVYFVSTRSETGKAMLEKYPVGSVPAGIYITRKPGVFYSESLAYENQNQAASLNKDNLERLFLFQTDGY